MDEKHQWGWREMHRLELRSEDKAQRTCYCSARSVLGRASNCRDWEDGGTFTELKKNKGRKKEQV